MEKKTIKIIDQAFGHELYCGHKIGKNESKNIIWDRSRQINKNDIVVFTDSCLNLVDTIKIPCKKVAWLIEPPAVQSSNYDFIKIECYFINFISVFKKNNINIVKVYK